MAYKCLAVIVLCATVLALSSPAQARDLLIDRTVTNCREYGFVNKERVCTRCENDHILIPGGRDCQRVSAGCKDPGFDGGRLICKVCKDDHIFIPGTRDCQRRIVGH